MLVFDIETNGLYQDVSQLHCMAILDTDTDTMYGYDNTHALEGVSFLYEAWKTGTTICGHNIINYDLPVLAKLYPEFFHITRELQANVIDTLVLSRLIYTNLGDSDSTLMKRNILPSKLFKSQSLKAWGYRLGVLKGTYGEQENVWDTYTPEMLEYNKQDVVVTDMLCKKLQEHDMSMMAVTLEREVAWLMAKQERNGFPFDLPKAEKLLAELRGRAGEINARLIKDFPLYPDRIFVPKRDNKRLGYKAGVPIQKYKDFNPNSRQQIEWLIRCHFGYEPQDRECYNVDDESTPLEDCRLKIDEDSIRIMLNDPLIPEKLKEVLGLLDVGLMLTKRLGQLADGKNAWLKMIGNDGRIHGSVITNGAVTGRATHNHPNVAQVPSVGSPYGEECRELFNSGEGWIQAGIDACGLELRCLAHYMHPYDNGEYAHIILNGDIHTKNQEAAGLPTRNQAKTFIYAFLYGAGDAKIGKIIEGDASDGKIIKNKFMQSVPALAKLRQSVQDALVFPIDYKKGGRTNIKWKRHYLMGLDKRKLHVRSVHSALNLLLQSAGALICKKWIVRTEERLLDRGLKHGWDGDFCYMAWVHKQHCVH